MGLRTRVGVGLSTLPDPPEAAAQAAAQARGGLAGEPADLAFLFLTQPLGGGVAEAAEAVRAALAPGTLLGCVAQGVLGNDTELEQGPGVSVWAASLPGGRIEPFHAVAAEDGDGDASAVEGVPDDLVTADVVAVLADPFTFPAGAFLEELNEACPGVPVVGGIAVAGPGAQALVLDEEIHGEGAVGVALHGVPVRTVVSQGCAPIGHDSVITRAEGNVVLELAGQPAVERLRQEIESLPPEERMLAARGLLAGLVIDENKPEYGRGDFLVRGLLGADEESGAIAIGELARVGQTLRFHVRDADSADEDLRESLAAALGGTDPAGALLFTCNGRGTNMFPAAHHDARVAAELLGSPAVAGFFCGGEIGPVGGRAFLHGFTATLAVFLRS
jgi:small ligand-binding sensory domain FIST